ncbi:unnamed protein product [Rangifer tarandus platyrhynchus]|uniref:Uncharacterized protein n=2 Tax=Rangifer tarandus platyrhynchus TaxID=3082113 RepID=A0ABN8Z084_RANTA|nr:unnamed protein product [Rangifer tarandus platyrhynchus]CAI9703011.1 unnamed protein product [Rangifer tarandus platyrhynchus]
MGTCKYRQVRMRTKPTDAVYCDAHLLDEQMLDCSQRGFCRHTRSSQISFNPSASGFLPAKRSPALLLGAASSSFTALNSTYLLTAPKSASSAGAAPPQCPLSTSL